MPKKNQFDNPAKQGLADKLHQTKMSLFTCKQHLNNYFRMDEEEFIKIDRILQLFEESKKSIAIKHNLPSPIRKQPRHNRVGGRF